MNRPKKKITFIHKGRSLTLTMGEAADWQREHLPEECWLTPGGIASRLRSMKKQGRTTRQVLKIDKCEDGRLGNKAKNKHQGKIEKCLIKEKFNLTRLVPIRINYTRSVVAANV